MRTGTVATIDNRNWELVDQSGPVARLSQARAVALDMESATIAANGFRFRVPYGTLLWQIGIRAMETLRGMPLEKLHSRKLRSFDETAFL
jgi:AMP nucleosidase